MAPVGPPGTGSMAGPYLISLTPIVGGAAPSGWARMSSVPPPPATTPRLYHASALVSSFMIFSLSSSHIRTLHYRHRSMRLRKKSRERMVVSGVSAGCPVKRREVFRAGEFAHPTDG